MNFPLGRGRSREKARGNTPGRLFRPEDFTGLKYLYDNRTLADGSIGTTLADRSANARTLTCSGTATAQPVGSPRGFEFNAQPALIMSSIQSQYAQDQAGSNLTYAGFLHQAGVAVALRFQVLSSVANSPILTNWGGATSNQNALTILYEGGTEQITVYVTSKTGGGTIHIAAVSTAGEIRCGDVVTLTFEHKTDKTWILTYTREKRANSGTNAAAVTRVVSNSYANTIDATACDFGLTLNAYGGLATFGAMRLHTAAVMTIGSTTTAELVLWRAAVAQQQSFALETPTSDNALAYPANFGDATHPNDSGMVKLAALMVACEQAVVTALGAAGTIKCMVIGDSRFAGSLASVIGTTDARTLAQSGATYTRSAVGPVDDGTASAAKKHNAISGYVTRTTSIPQTGHSQRSASGTSIDVHVGPGKLFNDTRIFTLLIGVNDEGANGFMQRDFVHELALMIEYIYAAVIASGNPAPGFAIITEPVTGTTTTGPLQRRLRSRNRAYSALKQRLASASIVVRIGNANDESYNP